MIKVLKLFVLVTVFPLFANAEAVVRWPMPTEHTVLTVSGEIENAGAPIEFDLPMLRGMETITVETTTIWTEGLQVFEGILLKDFLESLNVEAGVLTASAINDYKVDIPVSDAIDGGPILAFLRNGEEMSIRDKGPIWVIYPYDSDPNYRSEIIYTRSIWQLDRIEIKK